MRPVVRRILLRLILLVFLLLPGLKGVGAQNLRVLVENCAGGDEFLLDTCQEATLGVQAAQSLMGLAASGGTALPGSASTMGWRTKGSPRLGLSLRGTLVRGPLFDMSAFGGWPKEEAWDGTVSAAYLAGTVGLFDGFSPTPTMGGVGSIDLMASGHWMALPRDGGFQESSAAGWGIGGRLGILRESFSLPGISFSFFYRSLGTTSLWEGSFAHGEFEARVLSVRGVTGKDLWGVGWVAGAGWDRYSGDVSVQIEEPFGQHFGRLTGDVRSDRRMAFVGASLTFLVLQVSAEVGLAEGLHSTLVIPRSGGTDPSSRTEFGSLAVRLTF